METKTTKCPNPAARVRTDGQSKKNAAPNQAALSDPDQRLRKTHIPAAPAKRQAPAATFDPAKNPSGSANANITAFVSMNPQASARLVPCKKLGDHHGQPPTFSNPRQKSPALEKFANNSCSDTGLPNHNQPHPATTEIKKNAPQARWKTRNLIRILKRNEYSIRFQTHFLSLPQIPPHKSSGF